MHMVCTLLLYHVNLFSKIGDFSPIHLPALPTEVSRITSRSQPSESAVDAISIQTEAEAPSSALLVESNDMVDSVK